MNRASRLLRFALLTLLLAVPGPVLALQSGEAQAGGARPDQVVLDDARLERRTREVASQLRCVVCQGVSIEASPSQLAREMRALVRDQLAAGRSESEVKQYFVDRYGEWVLLEPEPTGFNLLVYVLPVLMLLGGATFVGVMARRWTTKAPAEAEASSPTTRTAP